MKRKVAIYKSGLLPPTQTFITAQANALSGYDPFYVGLETVPGGRPLGAESVVLVKQRTLPSRLKKVLFKTTGVAPGFYREIASVKPALLHAHFILDGVHALRITERLKLPLVVTLHAHAPTSFGKALPAKSLDNLVFTRRLPALWKRASVFICVSDFIRRRALELGYPESKLRVHYIGVDRTVFKPSDKPRDPKVALFVGRLVERKGVRYLIEAMAKVKQTVPDARLVIIGHGPDRQALEKLSQDLKVNAEFLGPISDAEVRQWLARARIFTAPSITAPDGDAEALGMVFAEAQSTGLPVVSCYHGGVPEVVLDGKTGLLAQERDSNGLADHIQRLFTDDAFWQTCSTEAVKWIDRRFDLKKQTEELERIYSSVSI
jgi:colanic acid/amylovoran biosynthesis glycosyltransferase